MTMNSIDPTALIAPTVRIGTGNTIGAYTVITGDVLIGDGNWIGSHVTIGTPAQYVTKKFELNGEAVTGVEIGNRCVIREYCTVHQPSELTTVIEDDCYLMSYCHVSHDTRIRKSVCMANNAQIGGFSEVQEGAVIGLSTVIHQYSTIGAYAMIGMASVVSKDVPPFCKALGNPIELRGINSVGLKRNGFSDEDIATITRTHGTVGARNIEVSDRVRDLVSQFTKRNAITHRPTMMHVAAVPQIS